MDRCGHVRVGASPALPMTRCRLLSASSAALMLGWLAGTAAPAHAQVESFLWGPGSKVGPATKVEPKNCVTAEDGSISCDTQLVNPAGDTPAKPQYNPFKH